MATQKVSLWNILEPFRCILLDRQQAANGMNKKTWIKMRGNCR